MSKNVKIKEGSVSKVFNNVEKLVTNDTNNGTDTWIPEDEADSYASTTDLSVSKNGVYEAPTAGVAGYKKVTVNVASTGIVENGDLIETVTTNISPYILIPNIYATPNGYRWKKGEDESGEPIKTFSASSRQQFREVIRLDGNHLKTYFVQTVVPNDYSNVAESETELADSDKGQLYFVSISDFSKGLTTINPKTYNSKITPEIEDMYKCRRLKAVGDAKSIFDLYTQSTTSTHDTETHFNFDIGLIFGNTADINFTETEAEKVLKIIFRNILGNEYGWKVTEDKATGNVETKIIRNNLLFEELAARFYSDVAEAKQDVGKVPADVIAVLRKKV